MKAVDRKASTKPHQPPLLLRLRVITNKLPLFVVPAKQEDEKHMHVLGDFPARIIPFGRLSWCSCILRLFSLARHTHTPRISVAHSFIKFFSQGPFLFVLASGYLCLAWQAVVAVGSHKATGCCIVSIYKHTVNMEKWCSSFGKSRSMFEDFSLDLNV